MSLNKTLLTDLERQYYYDGVRERVPTICGLLQRFFSPRFMPVLLFRIAHALHRKHFFSLARLFSLINFVLFGIEIGMQCEIGDGLYLPHTVGTVIGAQSIGVNAVIYHNVTIGAKEIDMGYHPERRPIIGNNVNIGAGAKILGGIIIGNNVTIGANAVVTKSLPDNVVAVGIPAQIIRHLIGNPFYELD
jgi:serine O-acetyltransferase